MTKEIADAGTLSTKAGKALDRMHARAVKADEARAAQVVAAATEAGGTDMTATVTLGEGSAFVFVAVDHCTTECIGLHAAKSGSRFEALEPIRQGVRERVGAIGQGVALAADIRRDMGNHLLICDRSLNIARRSFMSKNR